MSRWVLWHSTTVSQIPGAWEGGIEGERER